MMIIPLASPPPSDSVLGLQAGVGATNWREQLAGACKPHVILEVLA